jgi:ABC-type multidrug transport system fused ATPase/permease subunit
MTCDAEITLVGSDGTRVVGAANFFTGALSTMRDAPILILDEPTSALDVATEALVMAGIERLVAAPTTFIIAHRLSTVRRCDRIVVLRDGAIAEEGTLPELLRRDGVFAQ